MSEPPHDIDYSPVAARNRPRFRSHELRRTALWRIELHPSKAARKLMNRFALAAIVALAGLVGAALLGDAALLIVAAVLALVGVVLALELRRQLDTGRVFDTAIGQYWWAKRGQPPGPDAIALTEIRALMLVGQPVGDAYLAYQLNLVLVGGRRVNVIAHGDRLALVRDAREIAALLDRPVWIAPALQAELEPTRAA